MIHVAPHILIPFLRQIHLLKRRMEFDPRHSHILQFFNLFDHMLAVGMQAAEGQQIGPHDLSREPVYIRLVRRFRYHRLDDGQEHILLLHPVQKIFPDRKLGSVVMLPSGHLHGASGQGHGINMGMNIDNELLFSVQIGSFLPPVLSCFRFKYFGVRYFGIGGQLRL